MRARNLLKKYPDRVFLFAGLGGLGASVIASYWQHRKNIALFDSNNKANVAGTALAQRGISSVKPSKEEEYRALNALSYL
jgi:hypothetical protein